jgi:hypothetical protein
LQHFLLTQYDATNKRPIMLRKLLHSVLLLAVATPALCAASQSSSSDKNGPTAATETKVITAIEAAKFLPNTVFFRGQSAPIQARNSSGVQFTKDSLLLVTLVDTAGYSSALQEKYQAYLITESAIDIEGHRLVPGAYGCGFVADKFVVMDIGGHDLFTISSAKDAELRRPTPLQILQSTDGSGYRLYSGRNYIKFSQAASVTGQMSYLHP